MDYALAEPAFLYMRLLNTADDLGRLNAIEPAKIWWLRGEAIRQINEALQDPGRATSTGLILAVGRVALHESFYGDRELANRMHRPAQKRMIEMRGGLKALGLPGLSMRLMRWTDDIMSKYGGTERFLEDDPEQEGIGLKQSADVLDGYRFDKGQELRKRIRIRDLMNDEG